MTMVRKFIFRLSQSLLLLTLLSCQTSPAGGVLRVGMSPDYPPLTFLNSGETVGIEVDFARALARQLQRKLTIEVYDWDALFNALDKGEVDIVMSGVSITAERSRLYLFSEPYYEIGQMAMVRIDNAAQLNTGGALHSGRYKIGFVEGTTGEEYVQAHLAGASYSFADSASATGALADGIIDVFIHDAPTIWLLANGQNQENDENLVGLFRPLTREPLAWVFARNNHDLKNEVDIVLAAWQANGFTDKVINQWLPVTITAN